MTNIIRAIVRDTNKGSINNQYDMLNGDEPVAKYMKTVGYAVSGSRINPNSPLEAPELETFILRTSNDDFAPGTWGQYYKEASYWRFNYMNDVVELYSDAELRMFKLRNKALLDKGLLIEYDDTPDGKEFEFVPAEMNPEEERLSKQLQWGKI
jgi:hypothetical protein